MKCIHLEKSPKCCNLLYKCPEVHRGKKENKERKKERELTIGKGRDREEKTETKRKKGLDTCKARVAPTC